MLFPRPHHERAHSRPAADHLPSDQQDQLELRLERLTWPGAAEETKARCLRAILDHLPAESPAAQTPPAGSTERVLRYELTRRRVISSRGALAAPRLQPRFATRL